MGAAVSVIAGAPSAASLCLLAACALILGLALFQVGRGLNRVATTPRWTLALLGLWLMFCSALVVLLSLAVAVAGHGMPSHVLGADGPWANAPAVLGLALILSVSIAGVGWLARHGLTVAAAWVYAAARDPSARRRVASECQPAPAPLLAGWSDRGPPPRLSPQTI